VSDYDARVVRESLESAATLISQGERLDVVKQDPDDNRVIECALAGRAHFIVSGDRHLLGLNAYEGIPIVTIRQFMSAYDSDFAAIT
jgi:predicted nucleic acid-binding protein